mgnify:CR=1 FL=1|jgi:hypothetical protein
MAWVRIQALPLFWCRRILPMLMNLLKSSGIFGCRYDASRCLPV